jgi:hypothetical protein
MDQLAWLALLAIVVGLIGMVVLIAGRKPRR